MCHAILGVTEHGLEQAFREDQGLRLRLRPDVLDVRVHRQQQIGRQRPRGRGPDQERATLLALDGKPHIDRRVIDFPVTLRHLVRRECRADSRVVRHDLVALIDQVAIPDLLQQAPDRFDVTVVQREVGFVEVDPESHALSHRLPVGDVAHDRDAAFLDEVADTDLALDALLVEDPELLLDLVLDGQPVSIPASLSRTVKTAHRLVTRVQILERPGEHMVNAGTPVGRRRTLVEDEQLPVRALLDHALEHALALPEVEHFALELGTVVPRFDWLEHRGARAWIQGAKFYAIHPSSAALAASTSACICTCIASIVSKCCSALSRFLKRTVMYSP